MRRPKLRTSFNLYVEINGDEYRCEIEGSWSGRYRAATRLEPEEFPEFEWDFTLFDFDDNEIKDDDMREMAAQALEKLDVDGNAEEAFAAAEDDYNQGRADYLHDLMQERDRGV